MTRIKTDEQRTLIKGMKSRFIIHFCEERWGNEAYIMEKKGRAFARIYWFKNEPLTAYLDMMTVEPDSRGKGLGTQLQELRESIALKIGATNTKLWVDKTKWMFEWYQRRGYQLYETKSNRSKTVWMRKELETRDT